MRFMKTVVGRWSSVVGQDPKPRTANDERPTTDFPNSAAFSACTVLLRAQTVSRRCAAAFLRRKTRAPRFGQYVYERVDLRAQTPLRKPVLPGYLSDQRLLVSACPLSLECSAATAGLLPPRHFRRAEFPHPGQTIE